MIPTALAHRYARALVDVIFAKGEAQIVLEEVNGFQSLVAASSQLREVISNPTIPHDQKENLLKALVARLKFSQTTINFLSLLLRNQRLMYLEQILEALKRQVDQRQGVISVEVTTAQVLKPTEQDALITRLKQVTGQDVRVTYNNDPNLIGGVVTRIGSRIYDGSVRRQLDSFRERIVQG